MKSVDPDKSEISVMKISEEADPSEAAECVQLKYDVLVIATGA